MMEKESLTLRSITNGNNRGGGGLIRSSSDPAKPTSSGDFGLHWGSRKRLRCMKIQVKDDQSGPTHRTTVRVDRRVVRAEKDSLNHNNSNHSNGYFNLRQRPAPHQPPPPQRILRNSENSGIMRGQSNGVSVRGFASPDRGAQDKRSNHNHHHVNNNNENNSAETAQDSKKGGSSSGSGDAAAVWPPKFVIGLTNKEKEEDFMAIKGSKLPVRPKKRAKFVQRTLNLVSPGAWLCDLTLERYEVREKKISKKRPRGLKAMGNHMESDSE